ncbi:MAG: ribonuclease III [Candidatus Pacebacteria bacterium]|nr:ribonuclease III [Candidatus Paceibacterota bacterium]MDD5012956.1 ribonuclease III [Candidatus Paceibacterota bacterium]MDD5752683.1 ribonuclease III [Candidatus Paceibacterota bacterium]
MINFEELEKNLNISFKNKDLLTQAFCHRSYLNENPDFKLSHNERLEFLGDAVLELVTTEYIFTNYPDKPEGDMTSWRASLVNANTLYEVALEIKFNEFVLLSQGEEKENGRSKKYILADSFEAFIGSLYLDQGYQACKDFIEKHLIKKKLEEIIEKKLYKDPKSLFQERSQEIESVTPTYQVIEETGPDHMKNFIVGVFLKEQLIAEGEGLSKHEAELNAASKALKVKKWE